MNIFDILKNLYTNPSSKWINEIDERDISPVVIQRFLSLNLKIQNKVRLLSKFVFNVSPKIYLGLAWSLLFFNGKKLNKAPFIKYPKTKKDEDTYQLLYDKIKRQYNLSDRSIELNKKFLKAEIDKNKPEWFSYYGMDNAFWHTHETDFNLIKEFNKREKIEVKQGLDMWM